MHNEDDIDPLKARRPWQLGCQCDLIVVRSVENNRHEKDKTLFWAWVIRKSYKKAKRDGYHADILIFWPIAEKLAD